MTLAEQLRAGCDQLGLGLPADQERLLLGYLELLQKWNKVYNLTAIRDAEAMLTHHLLDSLSVVGPLRRHSKAQPIRLLDVGSGGGMPGVVIAICCPEVAVDCVDTVAKKAAFVQQVAAGLRLPNLRGVHARVEAIAETYDVVCSRAFATLADFTAWSRPALAEQGTWMAMKGKRPDDEIAALPTDVEVFHVEQITVPGLDANRCIVWMRQVPAGA